MKSRILIADADHDVCEHIMQLVQNGQSNWEVSGISHDGEGLAQQIRSCGPDIVVADVCLPMPDGQDVLSRFCRGDGDYLFIAICGEQVFSYPVQALKCGAFDFLLKPLDPDELHESLKRAASKRQKDQKVRNDKYEKAVKHLFLSRTADEMSSMPKSIDAVNEMFGMQFSEGLFRMIDIKIDCFQRKEEMFSHFDSLMTRIQEMIGKTFEPYCHELLSDQQINSVQVLLNYAPQFDSVVKEKIAESLEEIKHALQLQDTADITFCVSRPHQNFRELALAKQEMGNAYWSRLTKGTGRVLYWENAIHYPEQLFVTLTALEERIKRACEIWDIEEFRRGMDAFLQLPTLILGQEAGRVFIRDIETYMFNVNREEINAFSDVDSVKTELRKKLKMTNSIMEYKDVFVSEMVSIFERILDNHRNQGAKAVRQAIQYIKDNYNKDLHLENVAKEVHLSSVYFSALFKRETGQNFTNFVTDYRIHIAKELLRDQDMKIRDVAESVGFFDQKYFSKIFVKSVGLKPTQYKKLFDNNILVSCVGG